MTLRMCAVVLGALNTISANHNDPSLKSVGEAGSRSHQPTWVNILSEISTRDDVSTNQWESGVYRRTIMTSKIGSRAETVNPF